MQILSYFCSNNTISFDIYFILRKTIVYIYPSLSSFVKNDLALLRKKFNVLINTYAWNKKYNTPFFLLHQFFFLIFNINKCSAIFISSGGYWSLLPTLMGKLTKTNVYIILNGSDCASIPPYNYGVLRKFPLKQFCKYSYSMASKLLPVSSSLIHIKNLYYSDDKYSTQGFKHFFPKTTTETMVLHNGCDSNFWTRINTIKRDPNSFIAVFSESQFYLKGGDMIVEMAKIFPQLNFYIAGCNRPNNQNKKIDNLYFLGKLSPEEIRERYSTCQFHLQLSVFEGFGCALAEAMLCECIPIGSSVNIIPEIIGNTGLIVQHKEISELVSIIKQALSINNKDELGKKARKRIINNYNIKKREQRLLTLSDN